MSITATRVGYGSVATDAQVVATLAEAPAELRARYLADDCLLRRRRLLIAIFLAIVLVPGGLSLDLMLHPEELTVLSAIRAVNIVLLLALLPLLRRSSSQGRLQVLGGVWAMSINGSLAAMVLVTGGPHSTYWAGMNLVLLGLGVMLPVTRSESLTICLLSIAAYVLACLPGLVAEPTAAASVLGNNLFFLLATTAICVVAGHVASRARFHDFALRHALDARNAELQTTLDQLRRTEAQLIQSEKMNAIGSLAAGLLHEVNNPLNFTLTAVQLLREAADPGDELLVDSLSDIDQGMGRIRDIVTGLRSFAYPEEGAIDQVCDLADLVELARKFTAHELRGVELRVELDPHQRVLASKNHIVQVLVNLLTNAHKAVTAIADQRQPEILIRSRVADDRVLVQVVDNGTGIPAALRDRIFEPFFTTREVGEGMGMGLSICHTIVANHGGRIEVGDNHPQGTILTFDLALSGRSSTALASQSQSEESS